MRKPFEAALGVACSFALLTEGGPAHTGPIVAPPAFMVVVNTDNPISSIDREQLSKIFFKRTDQWPNGWPAEPIDLPLKEPSRAAFTRVVHRKTVNAVRAFWQQQIFSGRDVPPPEKATERDIVSYVRDHVSAVGYVSLGAELPVGVKALRIEGLAP